MQMNIRMLSKRGNKDQDLGVDVIQGLIKTTTNINYKVFLKKG
jgi:hypothetical protein